MAENNLLDMGFRKQVLQGIRSEENLNRKRDQQRRFDVYHDKQDVYILERLRDEFSEDTVKDMRKILSVNLAKRMIDEKSSVYLNQPERSFTRKSGDPLTDEQQMQLDNLYKRSRVNVGMKRSNIFFNLHDQCAIMVVPDHMGKIKFRAIPPHHYDVVPSSIDPEIAHAYILNVWDPHLHQHAYQDRGYGSRKEYNNFDDNINQEIADVNDRKALLERYIVWTDEFHFVMDGKGNFVEEPEENPIGVLPFVDVAPMDKDFQFFVRRGSSTVDFSIDYGMMLSDNANVIRLQAYSQAVIVSEKLPEKTTVGPNHILHLKLDKNKPELSPKFEFVTPSPDLSGTQAFLESLLSLHLTSEGQDPSILSPKNGGQRFQSALDRLLAMISKFDASRDDFDVFRDIESKALNLLVAWSNAFQNVEDPDKRLEDGLNEAILPDDLILDLKFGTPEAIQTKKDREDSAIKLMNEGLMSRKRAIMDVHQVSEEKAEEMLQQIDQEDGLTLPPGPDTDNIVQ